MHPYLNTAISAARSAGKQILKALNNPNNLEIDSKSSPLDLVTNVDKAAEQEICYHISKVYPEHNILGEEGGLEDKGSNVTWIIDPIDGTLNFVRGIPYYCVSIGVSVDNVLSHGVIYNPITDELFCASKGAGAQLDGKRIRVSETKELAKSLISIDKNLQNIMPGVKRHFGSAALDLAYVACGRLDAYIDGSLSLWDIAAGVVLVREAGGFVSDFTGGDNFKTSGQIIAGTRKIYTQIMQNYKW